jgi:integral membrane protein
MLKIFYKIALLEGISYLLFGVTMPLKYWMHIPEPNKIIGMLHGILFVAYILLVFILSKKENWNWKKTIYLYIASVIPFGTFIFVKK